MIKYDLHQHPLCHNYYPKEPNKKINLTDGDKKQIETYINWCLRNRDIDVIAITDHDLIESSLYAKEFVEKNNLPIKIITGAECEIHFPVYGKFTYVHLLVLGVEEIPEHPYYCQMEDVKKFIDDVHEIGGKVVMSHPMFYEDAFVFLAEYLDGYEEINRGCYTFYEGEDICQKLGIELKKFNNSDYHYDGIFHYNPVESYNTDEEFLKELLK